MYSLCIARAENDLLFAEDGQRYIDMFSGHGASFLGHANRTVTASLAEQLQRVWIAGGLETPASVEARTMVEGFFPASHGLAALYSTGMEAAEFAIRLARVVTGKTGVVGFERSMHGKSLATASLGWDNKDGVRLPGFHRLPFVPTCPEEAILERLRAVLDTQTISAVFVEPVQGSGGGHMASTSFYETLAGMCRQQGVLLVFDEILTGFYRTGTPFRFSEMGFVPDIVLIGKAMGNGFPVSGVIVDRRYRVRQEMLPGSTYAGNPLAATVVVATLRHMRSMDLPGMVAGIERTILHGLGGSPEVGITPRGRGALWILELPAGLDVEALVVKIFRAGVCVGFAGRQIRLLPAATIERDNLTRACAVIADEVRKACHG